MARWPTVIVLLLPLAGSAAAALPLGGQWAFSPGVDPRGSDPAQDDHLWPTVRVPVPWEASGFEGYDGFAWLRVHFPRPGPGDLYLYLGRIADADETYVNGVLIGSQGKGPPFPVPLPFAERWYRIPAGLVADGNVLAVHVFNAAGPGGILEGPSAARLGIRDRGPAIFTEEELANLLGPMPGFGSAPPSEESFARRDPLRIPADAARRGSEIPGVEGGIRLGQWWAAEEPVTARGTQARYAEAGGAGEVACPPAILFRSIRWAIRDAATGRPIRLAVLDAARFGFGARRALASGVEGIRVEETIFAPASRPAIVVLLDLDVDPPRPVELVLEFEPFVSIPPADPAGRPDLRWDPKRSALIAAGAHGLAGVVDANVAWRPAAGGAMLPGDPSVRLIAAIDPAAAKGRIAIAWTGAERGAGEALDLAAFLLSDPAEAYRGALQAAEAVPGPALDTGLAARDQAFAWARDDVLSSFTRLPVVGGLYLPWKGPIADAAREGISIEDALWIARAALRVGDWVRVRDALAALLRGTEVPGVPSRLLPGSGLQPAPELRASALLLVAAQEYAGWTGDLTFPSSHWDRLFAIASWIDAADPDGDGIPGPPGTAASIADASLRAEALDAAAEMAAGLRRDAGRWLETAKRARAAIARRFWLEGRTRAGSRRESLSEGVLSDGAASGRVGAGVAVALLAGGIDRSRTDATITALSSGDILCDWGLRSLSSADPAYDPARIGRGAVGAFSTGIASIAAFRAERPWLGSTLLDALARWPRILTPGNWPEWLQGDRCVRVAGSGDSVLGAAAYVLAVVDGLFGIRARVDAGEIHIRPAGIRHLSAMSLSDVRAGGTSLSIAVRVLEESIQVTVAPPLPPPIDPGLRAVVAAPVPPYHASARVEINRRREMGTLSRSGSASRLACAAPIGRRLDLRVPIEAGPQVLPGEATFRPLDEPAATRVVRSIARGRSELVIDVEGPPAGEGEIRVWSPAKPSVAGIGEVSRIGERVFRVRFSFPAGERTRLLRLALP